MNRFIATWSASLFVMTAFAADAANAGPAEAAAPLGAGPEMIVYYVDQGDFLEVVATYAAPGQEAQRVFVNLTEEEALAAERSGAGNVTYTLARPGWVVSMTAQPKPKSYAMNTQ
jgi:hypothetical protein